MEKITKTIQFVKELHDKVEAVAEEEHRTFANTVKVLCERALDKG